VLGDLERFTPYLQPGGLLFLDAQTHPTKPGVEAGWGAYLESTRAPGRWHRAGSAKHLVAWRKV
jgi:hypothetical protein